ncbi:hypothetical protein ALI144C_10075 [Actinosynnema sp. ALI-1.44]|uniref:MFS transporter n=1 Tax=Actinosynnema sp. ALI-1.44 TaxID=1933779 RepID=UPI00097CB959|nr:MFS transporter [Actinosynnema sp. ALI-1.44]ONI86981.1 hypothetical protein ALI144C_10075 [Actinosynnema sp. ALI-1.44]
MRHAPRREVFASPEFRAVWLADLLSVAGDQIARVGLAVLVYTRTNSAALTALTYALTFLPALFSGPLSTVADRVPRRTFMVTADLTRAVLVASMAVPDIPLPVLSALLLLTQILDPPHAAARNAALRDIFPTHAADPDDTHYRSAESIRTVTSQIAQLAAFPSGGLLAAINPQVALAGNALTFVVSAVLVGLFVRRMPPAATPGTSSYWKAIRDARGTLRHNPRIRAIAAMAALAGLTVVPEGLAIPYASDAGGNPAAAGLLMAADPLGNTLGAAAVPFLSARLQQRIMAPLIAVTGIPLLFVLLRPPLPVAAVLFLLSGACGAYLLMSKTTLTTLTPEPQRAGLIGRIRGRVNVSQGVVIVASGAVAGWIGPVPTIALAGLLCLIAGACVTVMWQRAVRSTSAPPRDSSPSAR